MSLHTPGFIKFWIKNDLVETKYSRITDIPIMNLQRQENKIMVPILQPKSPLKTELKDAIIIVHCKQSQKCQELSTKLSEGRIPDSRIFKIPDQNSDEQFDIIRQKCPGCLGKMVFNGPYSHPLIKFLKKNSLNDFYDYDTNSSKKQIKGSGIFVHDTQTLKTDYYSDKKIQLFFDKINGSSEESR